MKPSELIKAATVLEKEDRSATVIVRAKFELNAEAVLDRREIDAYPGLDMVVFHQNQLKKRIFSELYDDIRKKVVEIKKGMMATEDPQKLEQQVDELLKYMEIE